MSASRKLVELEDLRQRLADAEETLRAIRSGEVDALIVAGPDGDQVFSLKGAEQPYRVFVEQMQEGAVTLDHAGTVLYCNRRFADLMRSPLQRVIGTAFATWVCEPDREEVSRIVAGNDAKKLRVSLCASDGTPVPASLSLSRLPLEEAEAICCVVTDLTGQEERRALESAMQELRAAQERLSERNQELLAARQAAERASDAKDRFLAALSHELRTPLTPALITATELREDPSISESARQDLDLIRRNIELEARLIDDLLDITRIVNGKVSLKREVVDVHVLLESALGISDADAREKELTFTRRLEAQESRVEGDPVRIQQILWNLVRNAVKFTPPGGRIEVRSGNIDGVLSVTISDTGIGIEAEAMERLFTPFEQAGEEITREFGGLGLGLAISAKLVEMHGGRIAATSDGRHKGASFTVSLPVARAPHHAVSDGTGQAVGEAGEDGTGEIGGRRKLRILLVEDHDDTRGVLMRLLGRTHTVRGVGTVNEALRAAASERFDLVISDLGLPDASGLELMRQLSQRHGLRGIALSGYGMDDDVRQSRDAGFIEHITKPVDVRALRTAVERLIF